MNRRIHGADADANEIAATLYRIGNVLESMSQPQEALEHYLESLHMKRRIHHKDDEPRPDIAYALESIGNVLCRQGAYPRAQE
jgi:tetratricopeptide (TPR) repeat protein